MDDDEFETRVEQALENFFKKRDAGTYSIPLTLHYKQHKEWMGNEEEWYKNHEFVSRIREIKDTRKKQVFAAVLTFIVGIGWIMAEDVWTFFKHLIGK